MACPWKAVRSLTSSSNVGPATHSFPGYLLIIAFMLASSLLQTQLACFSVSRAFTVKAQNSPASLGVAEKPGTLSAMGVSKEEGFYGGDGNFGIESRAGLRKRDHKDITCLKAGHELGKLLLFCVLPGRTEGDLWRRPKTFLGHQSKLCSKMD